MNKQLLLIASLFTGFLLNAQSERSDLEKNQMRGQIKSATELTYGGVMKSGKIEKGELTKKEYAEFNKAGYFTRYDKEDMNSGSGKTVKTYKYENNNRKVESTEESKDVYRVIKFKYNSQSKIETVDYVDNKGFVEYHLNYKYNTEGLLVEIDTYKGDETRFSRTEYTHNSKQLVVKKVQFNTQGNPTREQTYTYDRDGNLIEERSLDKTVPNAIQDGHQYSFNEKKQKIQELYIHDISKFTPGFLPENDSQIDYEYNEHGDVTNTMKDWLRDTIVYIYDSHDNWIKSVKTTQAELGGAKIGEPTYEIVERQITYY